MKLTIAAALGLTFVAFGSNSWGQELISELGIQPGTPQARMLEKLTRELDVNKDGVLDPEEKVAVKKRYMELQQSALNSQDADGDGEVSSKEREVFVTKVQKFRETILRMHDADGDGKLNEQEMQNAQKWLSSHKQLPLP